MSRRDGVVVRASASQAVDLGFIPLVQSYQKTLKNDIYSFPACPWHLWEAVENKPASSLVVSVTNKEICLVKIVFICVKCCVIVRSATD